MHPNPPAKTVRIAATLTSMLALLTLAPPAAAGILCEPGWQPFTSGGEIGVNSNVLALTVWEGDLIAAGDFTTAGGQTVNRIARWDGTTWHPFTSGGQIGVSGGGVLSLTVWNDDLIAAGNFTTAGGQTVNRIARWDGSTWHSMGGMNSSVRALTVYDGELIAGGNFSNAGGVPASRIARWNGTTWSPLGDGMFGVVHSLAVFNGDLIVGGRFNSTGDEVLAHGIARWDGSNWHPIAPGAGVDDIVLAMTVFDGDLIVAGEFVAAYSSDCCLEHDGQGCSDQDCMDAVCNLAPYCCNDQWYDDECSLLAQQLCEVCADGEVNHIVRWDAATQTWSPLGTPTPGLNEWVRALAVYDGSLYAGGDFISQGASGAGQSISRIARWDAATESWLPLGEGTNNRVYSLAAFDDELIVGGTFTTAGGLPANRIARWDGCLEQPCEPPEILGQPTPQTVLAGGAVSFTVVAAGDSAGLSYQWRKGGENLSDDGRITGADTDVLTIDPVETGDTGFYDVVVSDLCDAVTSDAARLIVLPLLPPPQSFPLPLGTGAKSQGLHHDAEDEGEVSLENDPSALCAPGVAPLAPLTLAGLLTMKRRRRR